MSIKTRENSFKSSQYDVRELAPAPRRWWNWTNDENNERVLRIEGTIAESSWLDDEITPKQFKSELMAGNGDITVFIHSYGGDVVASAQIYNMLKEYNGIVTVKIDGIAASAASVIAMAGTKVLMSPMSSLMIHNPMASAFGDTVEMERAISMLSEIKESIINAYQLKTGLSRAKISHMMDEETWMNAQKAVELGFADDILYTDNETEHEVTNSYIFSRAKVINSIVNKLSKKEQEKESKISIESLYKRLYLLNH